MTKNQHIAIWLFSLAFFVALMVLVGGLTRLTDSGLSITQWRPVSGILPPLGISDWMSEFSKYQQIPEYQRVNRGMSLAEFKFIYWWEWGHRFLGRVVGLVFMLPFLLFWRAGYFTRAQLWPLFALLFLGGAQGLLGWYMVQSGLVDRVDVSQYRLAAHLGLAVIIFALCCWLGLGYWRNIKQQKIGLAFSAPTFSGCVLGALMLAQILAGALVAGLDAGLSYNDWPFMDGDMWPSGVFSQAPLWRNFFENHLTVQFNHRLLGYGLALFAAAHIIYIVRGRFSVALKRSAIWLGAVLAVQILLGILTLIWVVPIALAALHQLGAVIMLAVWVLHLHLLCYKSA